MNSFIQRHADSVIGMVSGWDRLRLRGTLRMLANLTGMRQKARQIIAALQAAREANIQTLAIAA